MWANRQDEEALMMGTVAVCDGAVKGEGWSAKVQGEGRGGPAVACAGVWEDEWG